MSSQKIRHVRVSLPKGAHGISASGSPTYSYVIHVGAGLLDSIGKMVGQHCSARKFFIVSDRNVGPVYAQQLKASLSRAGFEVHIARFVPAGDESKSLRYAKALYDELIENRIERTTPIIALGGGVIGDLAGFVAATILRGVPFIQVPTSLLAMVDASVGGKTAVNHGLGKNLIGAFYQPAAVFADPVLLQTLPKRELKSGLAECIKHEVIHDQEGFKQLERHLDDALDLDFGYLTDLITHNVQIKAAIVKADPYERSGLRVQLNFGHTLGHAIEGASNFHRSHGESVALGMVAESHISRRMKLLDKQDDVRVGALIGRAGLPTRAHSLKKREVIERMTLDKKIESNRLRFVLPHGIGHVSVRDDVSPRRIDEAIDYLRG